MGRSKGRHYVVKERLSCEEKTDETQEDLSDVQWHSYVALGLFISVYVKCTSASIPSGDAGDFILAAHHFGVAHPPGYPLYVTFGYLWIKIFPFGSPAFKLNLATSFIGGLAAWIVYITTYKITRFIPSAMFASAVFGFSHLIWFYSISAEIFALNNLFCGLLLCWVVRFEHAATTNRTRVAMEASFLSGLSLCNQHTSVLFIAVIGGWMFLSLLKDEAITLNQFLQTGAAFALGLLPYIQLPISAWFAGAPSTWGNQRTLSGIWKHFVREEYGTFRLTAEDDQSSDIIGNLSLSGKEHHKGVLERFWMQANIPVSILAGCGVWCVYNIASDRYKSFAKELRYLLGVGALLIAAHQIRRNISTCDMSHNFLVRDFGRNLLDTVPLNGVLLVEGDLASISASYLRYSEDYRPDVDVVDQELMGFDWYKTMIGPRFNHYIFPYNREIYFKKVQTRRGQKQPFSYNFLDVFDVHKKAGIPLYVYPMQMKGGDEEWKEQYDLVPTSMVYEVRHKSELYSIEEYLDMAYELEFDTSQENCDETLYPVRSWEHVITESCGNRAFIPAEYAQIKFTEDPTAHLKPQNRPTMIRIFNLYKRACDSLTVKLADGTTKLMFLPAHNENYGIMSYQLYENYWSTSDRVEAGRYARVMTDQLNTYMTRNSEHESKGSNDYSSIRSVLETARRRFPDLKENKDYDLV